MKEEIDVNKNTKLVKIEKKWYLIVEETNSFSGIPYDVVSIGDTAEVCLIQAYNRMNEYAQEMYKAIEKIEENICTRNKGEIKFNIKDKQYERVYFNEESKKWCYLEHEPEVEIRMG